MKVIGFQTVILCAIFLGSLCSCGKEAPPSFILVSIDTARADHFGLYGYERETTPGLDLLAEKGVIFDQAITVSNNTLISHASLLTGLFPGATGVTDQGNGVPLQDSYLTLSEVFKKHGYQTAGFTAHGDWLNERFGFNQGFDRFTSSYRSAEEVLADARAWLKDRDPLQPFFLLIHLFDVHSDNKNRPYNAPAPFEGKFTKNYNGPLEPWEDRAVGGSDFLRDVRDKKIEITSDDLDYLKGAYDEGLAYTDFSLCRFLDELNALKDLYLVITADHGEELQEHGGMLHSSLYDEVLHVPFILIPPEEIIGDFGGYRRIPEQVNIADIMPTILSIAGLPKPGICQGVDLLPWLSGKAQTCPSGPVPLQNDRAIRFKNFKFLRKNRELPPRLFNLETDPDETDNLAGKDDNMISLVLHLHTLLKEQNKKDEEIKKLFFDASAAGQNAIQDSEALERLRSLGYM